MKKLLALIITITSLSLTAQTKQNDATWEETVQFLKQNISRLNLKQVDRYNGKISYTYNSYRIDNSELTTQQGNSTKSAKLKDIEKYEIYRGGDNSIEININFLKNSVQYSDNRGKNYYSRVVIPLCLEYEYNRITNSKCRKNLFEMNDKFLKRMEKAFKHLAYLANQKRKKSKF